MTPEEQELAEKVAESCRTLGGLNITHESLGHVSQRLDDGTMLIRGKGTGQIGLRYTSARDILKVDFNADIIEGPDDQSTNGGSFSHSLTD